MLRNTPLETGETYHIFNRGAHKQAIFLDDSDYLRAQLLMYLHNGPQGIVMRDLQTKYIGRSYVEMFAREKSDKSLVDILAYCLMPNHLHIVIRQKAVSGVTTFMKKFSTAYSMYFNKKYEHSGTLFQGRFKSSHVDTDPYFKWIFPYVHLNPISLLDPNWREEGVTDVQKTSEFLNKYSYSSYRDYYMSERPERAILSYSEGSQYVDTLRDLQELFASYQRGHALYPMYVSVDNVKKTKDQLLKSTS